MKLGRGMRGVHVIMAVSALALVAGCDENGQFNLNKDKPASEDVVTRNAPQSTTKTVERDVEAPEVFQVTEKGLWDGRPSLGGVWAAHPDIKDPERVIIRNPANGKFVIGAMFRRERDNPGPRLQISSDAAEALGLLAGQPLEVNVTALRREEAPAEMTDEALNAEILPASGAVESTKLDPIASASAAIAAAESGAKRPNAKPSAKAMPKPTQAAAKPSASKASSLSKPFIQIGIFSVQKNANNTAAAMRTQGMVPIVKEQSSKGKTFWRVIVGPATNSSERATLMKKIKSQGFTDAYAVTN